MGRNRKLDIVLENVTIENVAAEGKAIAHTEDGMVVFVEFAVPGDVVDIQVTRKKKAFMEGRIIRIVKPSDRRLEPFCEHFGLCGGCRWQPLPYDIQLAAKQRQVYDQLTRIGHLTIPEITPIIGSDKTAYYRNKLEFTASNKRWLTSKEVEEQQFPDGEPGLGFHVGKFFDKVLDIRHCCLQPEPSNAIRLFIKDYALKNGISFYDIRANKGELRNMFVRTTDDGQVMLIVCFGCEFEGRVQMLDAIAERFPEIKVTSSTWNNIELNIKSAHKGNALKRFAEHLGFTLENCMAFGDGMNDFTMVEAAGLGIAMANAEPEVKRVAKYVTLSNDDDGVAKGIDKWIFSK